MNSNGSRLFHPSATPRTILGVWAHPDDEAYLSAAFMAEAVRAGHRVVVATATRGEGGAPDPDVLPPAALGPLREAELAASLELLGVAEHRWLADDLSDGSLHDVAPDRGRQLVVDLMTDVDPDLIVTFGPDGLTGHRDHQAVSRWVTDAWAARGCHGDLWYAALTQGFLQQWGELCAELGMWMSEDAPSPVPDSALVHIQTCDTELASRKLAALRAHASQTAGLIERIGEQTFARWWSYEFFATAT
jgi:LmbE family N-acetylglucosaminyl deacetylase